MARRWPSLFSASLRDPAAHRSIPPIDERPQSLSEWLAMIGKPLEADEESAARTAAESLHIPVIALSPRPQREAGVFALECHRGSRAKQGRAPESSDVALVLQTSGTTSQSKIVPLTQANLCASADHVRAALG
jgi:hypothetical protein